MKILPHPKSWLSRKVHWCMVGVVALLTGACVETYELPSESTDLNLLVVDGYLDLDNHLAIFKLARSQNLASANQPPVPEKGVTVVIETEDGRRVTATESRIVAGRYVAYDPALQYGRKGRVRIKTSQGKEYESDWVTTQRTPPIENLTWKVEDAKVKIMVSTQDPARQTRYYRWEFVEMYEYRAFFESTFKFTSTGNIVPRPPLEQIYTCWTTTPSTQILIATSGQLSEDRISNFLLATHEGNGDRFSRRYSMIARQYGISQAEFEYWQMLQKNTENVGSLFDAQPAFVTGNIRCLTVPEEPVLGFFSARSMSEKRLNINASELAAYQFVQPMPPCNIILPNGMDLKEFMHNTEVLSDVEVSLASKECADCRLKGGTNRMPSDW